MRPPGMKSCTGNGRPRSKTAFTRSNRSPSTGCGCRTRTWPSAPWTVRWPRAPRSAGAPGSANFLVDLRGRLEANPAALARVSVPSEITWVPDAAAARTLLSSLDPSRITVVEGTPQNVRQQPTELSVTGYRENFYQIRYSAASNTLVRVSVPYAPGWKARVDGSDAVVLPADYALSAVVVPAGQHELTLEYRPGQFLAGAALSGVT